MNPNIPLKMAFLTICLVYVSALSCGKQEEHLLVETAVSEIQKESVEKFQVIIVLPIEEQDLLKKLDERGVAYSKFGQGGDFDIIPEPKSLQTEYKDQVSYAYRIYGNFNKKKTIKEDYHIYVNNNGIVFHIERAYAYTVP